MGRLIFILSAIILQVISISGQTYNVGNYLVKLQNNRLILSSNNNGKSLSGELGTAINKNNAEVTISENGLLSRIKFDAETYVEIDNPNPECTRFTWNVTNQTELMDCVDFGVTNWFGGPEQKEQLWPIEKLVKLNYSYVTKEEDNMGVAERLWINSQGIYLLVDLQVPLFINSNASGDNRLCFIAKHEYPYLIQPSLLLRYSICTTTSAKEARIHALNVSRTGLFPREIPDQRMVQHPIWSTWARYKRDINETVCLEFANEILQNGFLNSQFEIDDDWETCYGELTFDTNKFPNIMNLTNQLKSMGFRVTLWVHPFVNFNCPSFQTWNQSGYFVKDENNNIRTSWWNGAAAAIVDFTNPIASDWYINRIKQLQIISGVDSFKYDAGETSWLPKPRVLNAPLNLQPNIYSQDYVNALDIPEFIQISEVRTGFETQYLPVFVRMVDKDTHWRIDNGLRSLVTTLLSMNVVGYSTVLPDMIGGNGYGLDTITPELFVRWLQATTFMPSLQFSYVPWQFNNNTITEICRKFVDLHSNITNDIMIAMQRSVSFGEPVNPPIYYAIKTVDDPISYTIDDEYMLGENYLIAPVMDEGATSRNIYLPEGTWFDMNYELIVIGPTWINNYNAPLDVLPYFKLL